MYIFKVFFNFIFICKIDKCRYHFLMPLKITYTHIHTNAEFFICNQKGPLPFLFSILFQHSLKGPNKLYSSFTEIKVDFLLFLMYSCRNKAKPKHLVKNASIIFCSFNLLNYLLKQPLYIKIQNEKNILIHLTQKKVQMRDI